MINGLWGYSAAQPQRLSDSTQQRVKVEWRVFKLGFILPIARYKICIWDIVFCRGQNYWVETFCIVFLTHATSSAQ